MQPHEDSCWKRFIAGKGEDPKESTDEDRAARADEEIRSELPTLFALLPQLPTLSAPLRPVVALAMIRLPRQLR